MISLQTLSKDDKAVRTQITLTDTLKSHIEDISKQRGESLSEYLRKAAIIRLLLERQEQEDLEKLAKRVVGSISLKDHPEWSSKKKVYNWIRKIREEKG
jgi:metal-responsive CopG/Arc/MetJ family transcriptional regulator